MAITAMGPTMAGGTQPIVKDGYSLLYLPDVNNWELQRSGQSPVFYYVPNQVRMARKEGPDRGDFLFNLIRFAGAQSNEGTIGAAEDREVAGGLLTFTVTGAAPEHVLRQSQQQIIQQWQNSQDFFWGIRGSAPPVFRPAIITANTTTISNVSPTPRGLPMVRTGSRGQGAIVARGMPMRELEPIVRSSEAARDSNMEPWYWHMQGEGSGSIDPTGTHAFSALVGAYPAAILWEAFHGTASPVIVIQSMKLKVWSPVVELSLHGEWQKIFEHFSAAAKGRYLWASVDIKAEMNRMRITGDLTVDVKVDKTIPGGEEMAKNIDQRSDLVFEKFMELAKQVIFEPKPPTVEPAQASSGGGLFSAWGAGVALKYRRDDTSLKLDYSEKRQMAYLQEHTISSSLSGMYDEMKRDPDAGRKYFLSVYLDDWPRKLARVCRPVAAWADKTVEFLSVQVGYPNTSGALMWDGHLFGPPPAGGDTESWKYQVAQKPASDVSNPPEGWKPDLTFIKRKVHLAEPPNETENPYVRIQIDRNVVELDPEPNGTPLNDTTVEVRADSAGRLAVGPIQLGVVLTDDTQVVEVVLEPTDEQGRSLERPQVRFRWTFEDYQTDRMWMIYTGDPEFRPFYRYKVIVTVKGTLFEPGRTWEGDWVAGSGNGALLIAVPRPGDRNVRARYISAAAEEAAPARAAVREPAAVGARDSEQWTTLSGWPIEVTSVTP
ncbi:hypothetical protein [Allorhizocola rhizosphaerae]|uniref:hypothetical protein n=1 Tax=Allorhizocola rhizosphaerae TaxID=1872709 RepID=UPI0013C367B3|nr:hypothetical protein [Allorhizocola rhizosphaerae]